MKVITLRADERVEQAIAYLTQGDGTTRSQVIRDAVLAAEQAARHKTIRHEAVALGGDASDRAETQSILEFMGGTDAW